MNKEKVFIANDRKTLLRLARKKMVDWIILSELEVIDLERNHKISQYLEKIQR